MTADVVVIGGGPGGYATALRAAARGLRVTVVEADKVGGTCLHRGCVPSKALLHVGRLADQLVELTELGMARPGPGLDVAAVGRFRDGVVDPLHRGLAGLLDGRGITMVPGRGRLVRPGVVEVADGDRRITVEGHDVVIATGSAPLVVAGAERDGVRVLSSDDALRLEVVPATGVVVGGGAVGVELASLWRSLGAEVTIVEAAERLLPLEDVDSSAALAKAFRRRGIQVRTGSALLGVTTTSTGVEVAFADGSSAPADQVLVAVGRRPSTAHLGLAELGVLDEQGYVEVDALGRTAVPGLWAVGDVVPTLALAHAAFAEGFAVADAIAGLPAVPVDHELIPRVTYCTPEVASVGLTETAARARYDDVQVTVSSLGGNARAAIEGGGGQVKLVALGDGTLVGAHVVGPSATELIAELGLATAWGALVGELADVVHAHPTLAEGVREAALAAAGLPFHGHA